nr:type IV secretion system protein [uncultured Cupriavidus sp.]
MASLVFLLTILGSASYAEESAGGNTSAPQQTVSASQPGELGDGIKKALSKMDGMRSSLISSATSLSDRVRSESDKVAFGLGTIALVLAGLRWASTSDAVTAWTDFLEAILFLGIFSALYVSYTSFGPAIFVWFDKIATAINSGVDIYNLPMTLAGTAGKFYDSIVRTLIAGLNNPLKLVDAIVAAVAFTFALLSVLAAAIIYSWFILVGHLMVAVGIVVGPLAVAFGMLDISRKYFAAWLDYMVTGSLYMVVAAIMAQLVSSPIQDIVSGVSNVGTDTTLAASYALSISIVLIFIAMEIPKISGSLFGTGGGISGTGGFKMLGRGAANLGKKLAGK